MVGVDAWLDAEGGHEVGGDECGGAGGIGGVWRGRLWVVVFVVMGVSAVASVLRFGVGYV